MTERGLFIELPEFAIEGYLSIESLDGYYQYDERKLCLRQRPGNRALSVGDKFRVQVAKVDIDESKIDFVPVSE